MGRARLVCAFLVLCCSFCSAKGGFSEDVAVVDGADGPAIRFPVLHFHGGGFTGRCYGFLEVSANRIRYMPNSKKDHAFDFARPELLDVDVPSFLGRYQDLVLKFRSGSYRMMHLTRRMAEQELSAFKTGVNKRDPRDVQRAIQDFPSALVALGGTPSSTSVASSATASPAPATMVRATSAWQTPVPGPVDGIYRLERQLSFNVLDGAYFDPASAEITLFGHRDTRYEGPRIPYLQHLAALLENPRPEFTLEWTPDSERRVNAFLNQKETRADAQRAAKSMAAFLDSRGKVNDVGKLLFPGWGVKPIRYGGTRRGYLGIEVAQLGAQDVRITRVQPGSPAERAGLRAGDNIRNTTFGSPLTPAEFSRNVGFSGEGYDYRIVTDRGEQEIKLGGTNEDPWDAMDREELACAVLRAAGKGMQAYTLNGFYMQDRALNTPAETQAFVLFMDDLGLTRDWQQAIDQYGRTQQMVLVIHRKMQQKLEQIFEVTPGTYTGPFDAAYQRSRNIDVANKAFGDAFQASLFPMMDSALSALRSRKQGVQITAELMDRTWGIKPEVTPKYMGVRSDTQLARAMLAGDYLGKKLVNMPELKAKFPAYMTQYEFLQRHPQFDRDRAGYRMWISVDRFRGAQSPDHSTFEVRDLAMRFNLREIGAQGRNLSPAPGGYGELLTAMYDDLSREYFVLHELREAAKLAGIAEWMRARDANFRLPTAGAPRWQSPQKLPGMVFAYLGGGNDNGAAPMTIFATGGVALTPYEWSGKADLDTLAPADASVVDLRHLPLAAAATSGAPTPVQAPVYKNEALARVLNHPVTMPEWRPEGWVGKATKGERTLAFVSAFRPASTCDSVRQAEALAELKRQGGLLATMEKTINALNANSPRLQQELLEGQQELEKDRDAFIENSMDLLSDNLLEVKSFLKSKHAIGAIELLKDTQDAEEHIDNWQKRLEQAKGTDRHAQAESFVAILSEIREELADVDSPRAARFREILKPFDWYTKIKEYWDVGEAFVKLTAIQDRNVERLNQDAEARNRELARLLPLQRKFSDNVDKLQHDPALQTLCPSPAVAQR